MNVQILVYKFLFTIVFFWKRKNLHETFHILKMNTPFEKEPHFENENTFQKRTTFWKWKHLPKKTTFSEWKLILLPLMDKLRQVKLQIKQTNNKKHIHKSQFELNGL